MRSNICHRCFLAAFVLLFHAIPLLAADPSVALPLDRSSYFQGENIPLSFPAGAPGCVELIAQDGHIAASGTITSAVARLPTGSILPGDYTLRIAGKQAGLRITIVSTLRESSAVLCEESIPAPVASQPMEYQHALGQWSEQLFSDLSESGVNVLILPAFGTASTRYAANDILARAGTLSFINPSSRLLSHAPPRVYTPELNGFKIRLALQAQANGRYPNFGGFCYDWNAGSLLHMENLLYYAGPSMPAEDLRAYSHKRDEALAQDFKQATRLAVPSELEFMKYCIASGHPEFAGVHDYPEYRRVLDLARQMKPPSRDDQSALELRVEAWSSYLMGLHASRFTDFQKFVRSINPSLRNSSSVNLDLNPVRLGQWAPGAYAPLDFRYMSAWSPSEGLPDYDYQWLLSAATLDSTRSSGQPIWITGGTGPGLKGTYPHAFTRKAAHILAYGGRGIGMAMESFTTTLSGANTNALWKNARDNYRGDDIRIAHGFLSRFAPLAENCIPPPSVGLLYSRVQMSRMNIIQPWKPFLNTFIALLRLGYTPRLITDDWIAENGLVSFKALVVVNQSVPLAPALTNQLARFKADGGRILQDNSSTVDLPGAERIEISQPFKSMGLPNNWTAQNTPAGGSFSAEREAELAVLTPVLYAALGNSLRGPLLTGSPTNNWISLITMRGGRDAVYVLAVNECIDGTPEQWIPRVERLFRNESVHAGKAIYELTSEASVRKSDFIIAPFRTLPVLFYALLEKPIDKLILKATQTVLPGSQLIFTAAVLAEDGSPIQATIPIEVEILDENDIPLYHAYRATEIDGSFTMSWPLPRLQKPLRAKLNLRTLLNGTRSSLPITLCESAPASIETVADPVIVRGASDLSQVMETARKTGLTIPLFRSELTPDLQEAAHEAMRTLSPLGVRCDLRDPPATSSYCLTLNPSADEIRINGYAEKGDTLGIINADRLPVNDSHLSAISGYVTPRTLLLFDIVGNALDSPMAERLDDVGILWPRVTSTFPGAGRAVIQVIRSPFWPGADAIIVQASDRDGLVAGAKALSAPPSDWIEPGIRQCRADLLSQVAIGNPIHPPSLTNIPPLTSKGFKTDRTQQSLISRVPRTNIGFNNNFTPSLRTPEVFPIPSDIGLKESVERTPDGQNIKRATNDINRLSVYYSMSNAFIETTAVLPGDGRFFDALGGRFRNSQPARKLRITIEGSFRWSDRQPCTQDTWEPLMSLWWVTAPKDRRPMSFDVYIDGNKAGALTDIITGEERVFTSWSFFGDKSQSLEEVVKKVSGEIEIPTGEHNIIFLQQNMKDSIITRLSLRP